MAIDPVTASAIGRAAPDLFKLAKEQIDTALNEWKDKKHLTNLHKKIGVVQKVKTIWQVEKEVKLTSFYYPSKLIIDKKTEAISRLDQLSKGQNYVIQGTIGQGKSTFLRYLCIQELSKSDRIPIFLELRRLERDQKFQDFLRSSLDTLGFKITTDKVFDFYATSGKLVLLLDAFDELDATLVQTVINSLEVMSQKYPMLQIIVSSRPDSGIERSAHFHVLKLAPLKSDDHAPFLQKIFPDKQKSSQLLQAIKKSGTKIAEMLTTPLMLTLLVLVYKNEQKIPTELAEFYDALFQTLISRHDKMKPGYVRKRFCKLSDRQLQAMFEAFCFITRQKNLAILNEDQFVETATEASNFANTPCQPTEFQNELLKVACLMQEEGQKYYFVHKSVQEYFAASFIKKSQDDLAIKFYEKMQGTTWIKWRQELEFLRQIDGYRFAKHFAIPSIETALNKLGCKVDDQWQPLPKEKALSLLEGNKASFHKRGEVYRISSLHLAHNRDYALGVAEQLYIHHIFQIVKIPAIDMNDESKSAPQTTLKILDTLPASDEINGLVNEINRSIEKRHALLTQLKALVKKEDSKNELLQLI
jgi:predicted NACHT family NTPase